MKQQKYYTLDQSIEQSQENANRQSFAFMFVNSRSGSCIGDSLIKTNIDNLIISGDKTTKTTFVIFDLYEQKQRKNAFQQIKQKCFSRQLNVYIIICGGDGTVQWVISQSLNQNIDFRKVIFSVLPIGTGNDFAKSVGWGNFQFTLEHQKFQKLALQLSNCKIGYYDIWESAIQCFQSGSIIQIKNGKEVQRPQNKLVKNFTNYFGIGTDAQIAYIAQKFKAKTVGAKKVAYGFAGILSFMMFCGGLTRKISQILQLKKAVYKQQVTESQIQVQKQEDKSKQSHNIKISSLDCCMTFLNSTSSMDLQKIWQTPYKSSSKLNNQEFKEQKVNDGLIQIVSYRNQISLWFQRVFHMAKKVGQGNGPFIINFRQPKEGSSHSIYIHINGQPYRITNTKSITVSQSSQFPMGKIRILYRNNK